MTQSIRDYRPLLMECRKFAQKEISGHVLLADLERGVEWGKSIWRKSLLLDLPALLIPEEFGGVGESSLCGALLLDEVAAQCAGVASIFAHHYAGCLALLAGSREQKIRYLSPVVESDDDSPVILSVVFPSEASGSRIELKSKDGHLVLTGSSELAGNLDYASTVCLFVAEARTAESVTCMVIDIDTQGISIGQSADLMGLKVNPFKRITFDDVIVEPGSFVGERRMGGKLMAAIMDAFQGYIAAMAMGVSRNAYLKARRYSAGRYQHGKTIIDHSEIQRLLGNMITKQTMGTAGYVKAFTAEAGFYHNHWKVGRQAKIFCTEAAVEITRDAIQIHGGVGYMHESGMEKLMRDSKMLNVLTGTTPFLSTRNISDTLKRNGAARSSELTGQSTNERN